MTNILRKGLSKVGGCISSVFCVAKQRCRSYLLSRKVTLVLVRNLALQKGLLSEA